MLKVLIVTPAAPRSRQGNRVTALRWARMLRELGPHVDITQQFVNQRSDMLVALHARRSAKSIRRFADTYPELPLVVALTGTDLYRDIRTHATACRSLELATRLIVLQPQAVAHLPAAVRSKASVIMQSAQPPRRRLLPLSRVFEICVAGHLRSVKDPFRAAQAARLLPAKSRVRVTHLGAALTPAMAERARAEMARNRRYRWMGVVSAARARQLIGRAQALVLSSKMEGGANVVSEALVAGTPVLASRISGSVGMLGDDYQGFFTVGRTKELADLIGRFETDAGFAAQLQRQCAQRAKLFEPRRERAALHRLLKSVNVAR